MPRFTVSLPSHRFAPQPRRADCSRTTTGEKRGYGLVLTLICTVMTASGCASYGHRVTPVPLPASQPEHMQVEGVLLAARAYADPKAARTAFGFDAKGAGLLGVQLVIDNGGDHDVWVDPAQTFLIDRDGQAWPLLTANQAYERAKNHLELGETAKGTVKPAVLLGAAGAIAGFAIAVVSGENVGSATGKGAVVGAALGAGLGGASAYATLGDEIRQDLAERSLENKAIRPSELAYGFLFFPGADEAKSAHELRLALEIGPERHVVQLPLPEVSP